MRVQELQKSAGPPEKCRSARNVQALQVLLLGLLLAGCAGQGDPEVRYVRVDVPVQTPCRAPEVAVPPWAAASLRKTDTLETKVRALLAERRQRIGYEKELEAAAAACR